MTLSCLRLVVLVLMLPAATPTAETVPIDVHEQARILSALEKNWPSVDPVPKVAIRELFGMALEGTACGMASERIEHLLTLARQAQDLDPSSKTLGNFRWNWTESKVVDANSVEFCMQKAVLILMCYRDRLSPAALAQLEDLITSSVEGIERQRVNVGYTNIFTMKAWNLLAIGQCTGRPELVDKGRTMLNEWFQTISASGIREYLSPTYTGVDLENLCLIARWIDDAHAKDLAARALNLMWADLAANWWLPGARLGGAHSRDYDYLTGHGLLDQWLVRAGWMPLPPRGNQNLGVFDRLSWIAPDQGSMALAGTTLPRMVWERWGEQPQQWAAQWLSHTVSLGMAGATYWNMDKVLVVNWSGGGSTVCTQGFFDGRGDPYGKRVIAESTAHSKALHLMPFVAAVQNGAEGIHVAVFDPSMKNLGFNREELVQLDWSLVLPMQAEVWQGDEPVTPGSLTPDPLWFIREHGAALAVRVLFSRGDAGAPLQPSLFEDGKKFGAKRLSWTFAAGTPTSVSTMAVWVRVGEVADDAAFAAFRRQCEAVTCDAALTGSQLSLATTSGAGRMNLSVDLKKSAWLASDGAQPIPAGSVLAINGIDVGQAALSKP